jgi:hypothetical protein
MPWRKPARPDWAVRDRMNLRAHQADVAQQAVVEQRELPHAGAPARRASHRIDHRLVDEANRTAKESAQRPVVARALLVAHDLHL